MNIAFAEEKIKSCVSLIYIYTLYCLSRFTNTVAIFCQSV